jgi:hypothetical protein
MSGLREWDRDRARTSSFTLIFFGSARAASSSSPSPLFLVDSLQHHYLNDALDPIGPASVSPIRPLFMNGRLRTGGS